MIFWCWGHRGRINSYRKCRKFSLSKHAHQHALGPFQDVTRLHERHVQGITLLCMYVVAYAGVAVSLRRASGCCLLASHRRKGMVCRGISYMDRVLRNRVGATVKKLAVLPEYTQKGLTADTPEGPGDSPTVRCRRRGKTKR